MANELDALDPQTNVVTLSTGTVLEIERLKARQFFKLLRIVTRGALPNMQDFSLFNVGNDMNVQEFTGKFLSMMLLSIPEAEDEAVEFIQAMVKPAGLVVRRGIAKLNKLDQERNTELWTKAITDTDNPELDDLVTIIEAIVKQEAADIYALGKRLSAMFKLAEKTGQLKQTRTSDQDDRATTRSDDRFDGPSQTSPDESYSEDSPALSTSSVTSMAGQTSTASTSLSNGYVSVSLPSENVASTPAGNTNSG